MTADKRPTERQSRTRRPGAAALLRRLERIVTEFGGDAATRKLELLAALARRSLPDAKSVLRLHEALCLLRAHPDDAAVLAQVEAMLGAFARRGDLRRHRRRLADSGISGTTIRYSFYAVTAHWLSLRHPGALRIVWDECTQLDRLVARLPQIVDWAETPVLDELEWPPADLVRELAGPNTGDADFLLRGFARTGGADGQWAQAFDELELEFELPLAEGLPSRTTAVLPGRPVHHQTEPLRRARPDLDHELTRPLHCEAVDRATGRRIIALARETMVVRHRDLDAFAHADPDDVRIYRDAEAADGLEFAVVGVVPERRLLLEAVYAYLTLKNGVPIGYVLTSGMFASSEVAYNVFETWRGGEAGLVYGRALNVTRELYGGDTFTVFPYQLGGAGNDEGLASGAWWFYQKLGFRAREPKVLARMRRELARMRRDPGHRTPVETLAELAEHNVYRCRGDLRDDVIGEFSLAEIGLAVTGYLAERFGADRARRL